MSSRPPAGCALAFCGLAVLASCSSVPDAYREQLATWSDRAPAAAAPARSSPEAAPDPEGGLGLDGLVAWGLDHAPSVVAAAASWKAALERVPQVTSLPDPRLDLAVFVSEVETRVGPMDWRIGLRQPFPAPGALDLRGRVALARAEAGGETFDAARLELVREVSEALHELGYLDAAIEVARGHRALLAGWEEVAAVRYETGQGSDADVVRAQIELGKLDDRVRSLEDLRRPVAARLNAVLGRAPDAAVAASGGAVPAVRVDEVAVRDGLVDSSPVLRALRRGVDAAELEVELAGTSFRPEWQLGVDYTAVGSARAPGVRGSGDDALALTAGLTLPIRRPRIRAAVAEAEANLSAARARLQERTDALTADLEMALYHHRDARRRVGLYRDTLVPMGRRSVENLTVAYQVGDADILDLVDAERVLLEFQLGAARARADHAQALAAIEQLSGVVLPREDP